MVDDIATVWGGQVRLGRNPANDEVLLGNSGGNFTLTNISAIIPISEEVVYATVAAATAATINAGVDAVKTLGYSTVGDPGAATYKRSASEPTHAGKFQSADGAWWELTTLQPNPYMFGAAGNGSTNDTTALQNLFDYADAKNTIAYLASGNYAVPSTSLTVNTNVQVVGCGRDAQIWRTNDVALPVFNLTSKTAVVLRNFAIIKTVQLTSTTSQAIATSGSKTFTVSANASTGLFPYTAGQFITIKAAASAANYMVGTVTSYTGTSLVLSIVGGSGSGTFTSWYFTCYDNSNAAVIMSSCTQCVCDALYVSGTSFYVGLETLNGTNDTLINNVVNSVWNRGLYIYATSGTSRACKLLGNSILGGSLTDYAINCNGSTAGYIYNAIIDGNSTYASVFDGIVVGGRMEQSVVSNNQIDNVVGVQGGVYVGIGILIEEANTYQASYNTIVGNNIYSAYSAGIITLNSYANNVSANSIKFCGTGIYCLQSGSTYTNSYHTFTGNNINGCTAAGISVATGTAGYSYGNVFTGNTSTANSTYGFIADANSDRLSVTGNVFYSNTTSNYSNSATNSQAAGNVTA